MNYEFEQTLHTTALSYMDLEKALKSGPAALMLMLPYMTLDTDTKLELMDVLFEAIAVERCNEMMQLAKEQA